MNALMLKLLVRTQTWMSIEAGQELTEAALLVFLVSLGATASLKSLSGGLLQAYTNLSSTFANNLS